MRFLAVGLLAAICSQAADERYTVDWSKTASETLAHFQALLRIDTSNPPGNETKAVDYLRGVLEREGIASQVLALEPGRANLVARIKGSGARRPVIIMGHTDVVGVQRDKWSFDPFAALRKDGYVYGRGALDDKDNLTSSLMVLLLLKRLQVPLDRDVIFVAEAGEEGNSTVGINFLVDKHWNEIDAEYVLAEGGGGIARNGRPVYVTVATTEKVPRGVRLIARGSAGHGSVPRPDNAVVRLANAVARIGAWEPPMRLNDTTRAYFERLATISPPEDAARYNGITNPAKVAGVQQHFRLNEIMHYSMLRTSVVPTIINAGFRSNVIPSEAEATLDIRALPDENMPALHELMRKVIDDPNVEIAPGRAASRPAAAPSRLDTEMFRVLEKVQRRVYPEAITLPSMLTGATDMAQLRQRGVQAYGVGPLIEEKDRYTGGAHGDDEKILESSLYKFSQFLWHAVIEIAAKP